MTKRQPIRPSDAPKLGTTYRDWHDFTDRVARPWLENDGDDPEVDNWYRTLMVEADPYYLACCLVIALNHVRRLEAWNAVDLSADEVPDAWAVLPPLGPEEMDTLYRLLDGWCLSHETTDREWSIVNSLRTAVAEADPGRR